MNPWDMRKTETTASYSGFCVYRDLGPTRTTAAAVEVIGRRPEYVQQLQVWSAKHDWVDRVRAWDQKQDRTKQEAHRLESVRMGRRQARQAANVQEVLSLPVRAIARKIEQAAKEAGADPSNTAAALDALAKLPFPELLRMVTMAAVPIERMAKLERLVTGETTEQVGHSGAVPVEVDPAAIVSQFKVAMGDLLGYYDQDSESAGPGGRSDDAVGLGSLRESMDTPQPDR